MLVASVMCFGLPRRGHRLFGNVGSFLVNCFDVAMLIGFGEKRCRKKLPLADLDQ